MDRLTWIYRLQQRIALTQRESWALLVIGGLLLVGQVVQQLASGAAPLPDYTATDAAFAEALRQYTAQQAGHALATARDPGADTDPAGTDPADSTAGAATPSPPGSPTGAGPLDLNTATAADLQRLPRIGPKLAARIVAYRSAHGGFQSVDELVNVRGIGTKTLAGLTPLLHIASAPVPDEAEGG